MITREIMKTHVVTVDPDATLSQSVDLMDIYQVDGLPVVSSDGQLCGMLSEQDVFRAIREHARLNRDDEPIPRSGLASAAGVGNASVRNYMVSPAVFVSETDCVQDALDIMVKLGVSRLPVVSGDGKVIGTLNRIDLFQALFEGSLAS